MATMTWWHPWTWTAGTWEAVGVWITFGAAVVAARFAKSQVDQARGTREDQAQPFVMVDFEPSAAWAGLMEIVIKNTGKTLAKDVKIRFDPPLQSLELDKKRDWVGFEQLAIFKRGIPTLPPGKTYRIFFDRMPDRIPSDLPRSYTATVELSDPHGRRLTPLTYVLDIDMYLGYTWMTIYGLHDAAKALRGIEQRLNRWTTRASGIRVYVNDEDQLREEEWRELNQTDNEETGKEGGHELEDDQLTKSLAEASIPLDEAVEIENPASAFKAQTVVPIRSAIDDETPVENPANDV